VMNFFESPTAHAPILYVIFGVATAILVVLSGIRFPPLTRHEHLSCCALACVLFIPRISYLFEVALGYSVIPYGDDLFHIQDLASIVHSENFPPRSTFDNSKYLSYYYAPWMLGAAIYWAGLVLTVKQAVAATILVYEFCFTYFAMYACKILFEQPTYQRTFLILCVFYGGFDFIYWFSGLTFIPSHSEWWAFDFGFALQFSNFFTLALWVQQHFISVASISLGIYCLAKARNFVGSFLAGVFFLAGFFSSAFVALGSAPIVAWFIFKQRLIRAVPVVLMSFLLFSLPLWWIYLQKNVAGYEIGFQMFGAVGDFWKHKISVAFLVFLLVIALSWAS
jgi:hypothetical protein